MKVLYYEIASTKEQKQKADRILENQSVGCYASCKKRKDIKKRYIQNYF